MHNKCSKAQNRSLKLQHSNVCLALGAESVLQGMPAVCALNYHEEEEEGHAVGYFGHGKAL